MHSDNGGLRRAAIKAMSVAGLATPPVVTELGEALSDDDAEVAMAAAVTLAHMGNAALPAIPALMEALVNTADGTAAMAKTLRNALVTLGKPAVPALLHTLDKPELKGTAVEILGEIGPDAAEAIPTLATLEDDPEVGAAVMRATALIQPAKP
jgi:HEAT repeat protein